jgi:hypothetical protein
MKYIDICRSVVRDFLAAGELFLCGVRGGISDEELPRSVQVAGKTRHGVRLFIGLHDGRSKARPWPTHFAWCVGHGLSGGYFAVAAVFGGV